MLHNKSLHNAVYYVSYIVWLPIAKSYLLRVAIPSCALSPNRAGWMLSGSAGGKSLTPATSHPQGLHRCDCPRMRAYRHAYAHAWPQGRARTHACIHVLSVMWHALSQSGFQYPCIKHVVIHVVWFTVVYGATLHLTKHLGSTLMGAMSWVGCDFSCKEFGTAFGTLGLGAAGRKWI